MTRLTDLLAELLCGHRVASLGTLSDDGKPFVSMVPFALADEGAQVLIHISALAPHCNNLRLRPSVSLMVMQAEQAGDPVHALPRVTFDANAIALERNSAAWERGKLAYLRRFPQAQMMTELGDFIFVSLQVESAHQVAGFGAARSLDQEEVARALALARVRGGEISLAPTGH